MNDHVNCSRQHKIRSQSGFWLKEYCVGVREGGEMINRKVVIREGMREIQGEQEKTSRSNMRKGRGGETKAKREHLGSTADRQE